MISLDYNATAPLWPEVRELLEQRLFDPPANPASVHAAGRAARARLDQARDRVAKVLGCAPRQVLFCASGSEAAATAVLGGYAARADPSRQKVVVSAIEHPCVLLAAERLEREGAQVVRVRPDASGRVAAADLERALDGAALCALMWVNNETGVVQPVAEVARACQKRGVPFFCDAVQALGRLPVSWRDAPADFLALSGHKLGAPAGVGALIATSEHRLEPLVPGHQEGGRRGGTPNVALCEALALALELSAGQAEAEAARLEALRQAFEERLLAAGLGVAVNGAGAPRAPGTSNLRLVGADGEALLIGLDLEGFCVASGAACASGSTRPSHVLLAMGLSSADAQSSLRFSFGRGTTKADLDQAAEALARLLQGGSPTSALTTAATLAGRSTDGG